MEAKKEKGGVVVPFGLVPDSARTGPHTSDPDVGDKLGRTALWHAIDLG